MANARDEHGSVFKNGTATLLARVIGADCVAVTQADFAPGGSSSGECGVTATYTVYLLDDQDSDNRTAVDGHNNVTLTITDIIYNALQTDCMWTKDTTGYNFKHTIDTCDDEAFSIAGRRYLVEYRLITVGADELYIRFQLNCI